MVMDIVKEADEVNGCTTDNRLRSLIERIEQLEEEKKDISRDIRDIYAEAKSAGYDAKIMRAVIRLRKMSEADREEADYLLESYCKALDM